MGFYAAGRQTPRKSAARQDEDALAGRIPLAHEADLCIAAPAIGAIDILVNAAGVAGVGSVHTLDSGEWDRVLDINLKGSYLVAKAALPGMLEKGAGSIVNI